MLTSIRASPPPPSDAGSATCTHCGFDDNDIVGSFNAAAAVDELRVRDRVLRFPRLASSSCIDGYGDYVLKLRTLRATICECHRALRDQHGLRVDRSTVSRWLRQHANGEG